MAKKKDKKPIKKAAKEAVEKKKAVEKKPPVAKKKIVEKKSVVTKKLASKKKAEEELEEEFDESEIENFQIEGLDMEKLTTRVCNIVAEQGDEGMLQSDLWKKLKLTSRDGSRLALKLERRNIVKREKILDNGRWTYKLKISKMPVSTQTIEAAPCLICPVEQKCSIDGEVSPKTCPLIEQWVITEFANKKTKK
ncbi:MAG TPA: transcriptional regulator [Nitrosopumilaceae archaeon]|nr:transcriptional regulator [Nitrosopumilaceae archaeon]